MAETQFSVTYGGPALESGRMEIRELAPALLALADIFAEANRELNPGAPPVTLHMAATGRSSFLVDLVVTLPDNWESWIDLASSDAAQAVERVSKAVLGTGAGLFGLLRWLRGRRVDHEESTTDGSITYTTEDGSTLTVPAETAALIGNVVIRRRVREVVEPLYREGVERVSISREEQQEVQLTKEDLPALEAWHTDVPPAHTQVTEMVLEVVAVAFKPGNKWRLSFGNQTLFATIADAGFNARVQSRRELFGKGDLLRCRVRIDQTESPDGLSTEWTVIEVLRHAATGARETVELPFDDR